MFLFADRCFWFLFGFFACFHIFISFAFFLLSISSVAAQELHVLCKASSGSISPIPILHGGNPACQGNFLNLSSSKSAVVWNVLWHNSAVISVSQRQKDEPIKTDVCNVKVSQTKKCREQEEHLIWRESLLGKAWSVCVCGGSRAAAVQAQLKCWLWGSCQPWKRPVELFQHLFIALVPLHTRQSAKPELNGISGGIYNRQNCGGLDVELKTVSVHGFFFNQVLTLRSKIWEQFCFGDLVNSNCIISFFQNLPFLPPTLLIYEVWKSGRKDWKVWSNKT